LWQSVADVKLQCVGPAAIVEAVVEKQLIKAATLPNAAFGFS
jgi:hypothetical protein